MIGDASVRPRTDTTPDLTRINPTDGSIALETRLLWATARRWLSEAPARRLAAALALTAAGIASFTLYESLELAWPPGREEAARFDVYHFVRTAFVAVAACFMVWAIFTIRGQSSRLRDVELDRRSAVVAGCAMAVALAGVGLLAADPVAFHAAAAEDGAVEWASALLMFAAAALFAIRFVRQAIGGRSLQMLLPAVLLALGFFVLGMEEISWFQRVLGFDTPDGIAAVNWQAEFNVHNIQTDLAELVFYSGAGLFLGLVPLVRDALPAALARHRLATFLPGRGVAAVAAPAAIFTFGQWNLLPVQLSTWVALLTLVAFAVAAWRRGGIWEALLFSVLAVAGAFGETLVLVDGPLMLDLPDASEYKEFFIAFAFAWYAVEAGHVSVGTDG